MIIDLGKAVMVQRHLESDEISIVMKAWSDGVMKGRSNTSLLLDIFTSSTYRAICLFTTTALP